jgi:hypothetical protein
VNPLECLQCRNTRDSVTGSAYNLASIFEGADRRKPPAKFLSLQTPQIEER